MRSGVTKLFRLTGVMALGLAGFACLADDDNPYLTIVDRNVFDLKAPTPPPPPKEAEPPKPPPNVKFTGTISVFGPPRGMFLVTEAPTPGKPNPGGAPKEESVIIKVGEAGGGIELVELDEEKGTAKIKNNGELVTLTLPLGPSGGGGGAPPPGGMPPGGMRPAGGSGIARPGIPQPGVIPPANPAIGGGQFRSPNFIQPQGGASVAPNGFGGGGLAGGVGGALEAGLGGIPQRDVRTAPEPAGPASAEEAAILLEANRMLSQGTHAAAIMPPPVPGMAALLGTGGAGQSGGNGGTPTPPTFPVNRSPFAPR